MGGFTGGKWKNDDQFWWTGSKPGDILTFAATVTKAGRYRVEAALTKVSDYGIVQFSIDGEKAAEPIDLYQGGVVVTESLNLGVGATAMPPGRVSGFSW